MTKAQTPAIKPDSQVSTARPKQGKARPSTDALKHGLAIDLILLTGEDGPEFEEFASKIIDDLQPRGPLQQALADQIVAGFWRLRRVPLLEAAVINERDPTEPERKALSVKEAARRRHWCAVAERYVPKDQKDQPDPPAAASEETEPKEDSEETTEQPLGARVGRALINDGENGDALGKLLRLETALSNTLDRTLSRLFALQSARGKREPPKKS